MPICLNIEAPKPEAAKPKETEHKPEWREPPGMLGVYVRRVKLLAKAHLDASDGD